MFCISQLSIVLGNLTFAYKCPFYGRQQSSELGRDRGVQRNSNRGVVKTEGGEAITGIIQVFL